MPVTRYNVSAESAAAVRRRELTLEALRFHARKSLGTCPPLFPKKKPLRAK